MEEWTVKSVDGKPVEEKQEQTVEETPKSEVSDDGTIKVNVDAAEDKSTEEAPIEEQASEEVKEEVSAEPEAAKEEEEQIIELIDEEPPTSEVIEEVVEEQPEPVAVNETPGPELPENVQKLVEFMNETGGSLEDYIDLNKSYDDFKPVDLVKEHYKKSKPHLSDAEISFMIEDRFGYDEDADDREKRSKEIAWKEEVYNAKNSLNTRKEQYYSDIKLNRRDVPQEFKEAQEFYAEAQKNAESQKQLKETFLSKTDEVFKELKGFDFKVGDKKYRYKVNDVESTKKYQSDLNNFVSDYLDDKGQVADAAGYHKALFAAKNADKLAQHFYEQGRADAIKDSAAKAKNINMTPRGDADSVTTQSGNKYKVVSGSSSNSLKINLKNY